jgi:hypothetical protein
MGKTFSCFFIYVKSGGEEHKVEVQLNSREFVSRLSLTVIQDLFNILVRFFLEPTNNHFFFEAVHGFMKRKVTCDLVFPPQSLLTELSRSVA